MNEIKILFIFFFYNFFFLFYKSFDKLYRKSLQDNIIDKNEYESLGNFFTKYVDENKNESSL